MSCQSIVMAHKTDIPLVVTSVQLLATVVSIPSPVRRREGSGCLLYSSSLSYTTPLFGICRLVWTTSPRCCHCRCVLH